MSSFLSLRHLLTTQPPSPGTTLTLATRPQHGLQGGGARRQHQPSGGLEYQSHIMERLAGGQALPDSWLNTLLCRNAHTLKAGGQPTGAGSTEDGLPGDPQHTCSEHSFRGPQARTMVLLPAKHFHVCPWGRIFFSGHSNPERFRKYALDNTSQ